MQETLLPYKAALHRPVVSPAKEAAQNAVEASQNTGVAKVVETPGSTKVTAKITVEAANEPAVNVEAVVERLLGDIFESKEAAQRDPEPEQLNKIFEAEEASQIDPDLEQLNEIFEVEKAAHRDPNQRS